MSSTEKSTLTHDTRFFYGLGAAPYGIKDNGFSYFLLIFYSQVLGLSPVMTSAALSIAIIVDAITDPIIGYISDNWRSRWGRRHPFMYLAIVPICVSYAYMWNPPADVMASEQALFVYLVAMAVTVRIFLTFFEVPNTALISELTEDYDARTKLMGLRYMFGWLGGIGMAFLAYSVFLRETEGGGGGHFGGRRLRLLRHRRGVSYVCRHVGVIAWHTSPYWSVARAAGTRQNQNWSGFWRIAGNNEKSLVSIAVSGLDIFRHGRRHAGRAEAFIFRLSFGG